MRHPHPPIKLDDEDAVYQHMATLMAEAAQAFDRLPHNGQPGMIVDDDDALQYTLANRAISTFASILMAHPNWMKRMICWSISISGDIPDKSDKEMRKVVSMALEGELAEAVDRAGGNLAVAVKKFIEGYGWRVTDQGVGGGGWDMAVRTNTDAANMLCEKLHLRFSHAIKARILKLRRYPVEGRLPNLENWPAAEQWLRTRDGL